MTSGESATSSAAILRACSPSLASHRMSTRISLGKLSRALPVDAGASDGDGLSHCRIILPSGNFKRYGRPWLLTRLFRPDQAACPRCLPLALLIPGHVVGIACWSRAALFWRSPA
jgi:hypothetical protein